MNSRGVRGIVARGVENCAKSVEGRHIVIILDTFCASVCDCMYVYKCVCMCAYLCEFERMCALLIIITKTRRCVKTKGVSRITRRQDVETSDNTLAVRRKMCTYVYTRTRNMNNGIINFVYGIIRIRKKSYIIISRTLALRQLIKKNV